MPDQPPQKVIEMAQRICSVEGCERAYSARGYCAMHYQRWRTHGVDGLGIDGSAARRGPSPIDQFMTKAMKTPTCWVWTGSIDPSGYGSLRGIHCNLQVHRWAYEHFVGPIPDGLVIDHTCHNADLSCPGGSKCLHRRCCNPAHLEPVTRGENVRRSPLIANRTHCKHGHEFTPENTYLYLGRQRRCRACRRKG